VTNVRHSEITWQVLRDLAEREKLDVDVAGPTMMAWAMAEMSGDQARLTELREEILGQAADQVQASIDQRQAEVVGARNLPIVPWSLLKGSGLQNGSTANSGTDNAAQIIMVETLKQLSRQQGLDGVLVIYNRSLIGNNDKVRHIMSTGRTLGHIKLNPTLVLVTAENGVVIDYGHPMLDDLSPMKILQHVYVGPQDALEVELDEPEDRNFNAYLELIDVTSERMTRRLFQDLR